MNHQPTFKTSPAKRPLHQRLTPAAWALIGVAVLVALLAVVGAALTLGGRRSTEVWWTPTPTATATATPNPTVGPTATPTAWYEGMISPTPEPTPAYPAWWSDQMTQDQDGNWWPPEEVTEMVRQHFVEAEQAHYKYLVEAKPPDIDGYRAVLARYRIGAELESRQGYLDSLQAGINGISWGEWEDGCFYQVQEWSEDGLECTLGQTCSNGTAYEYDYTGQLVWSEHRDLSGLILWRMRYDPTDGRWKIAQFLQFIAPPGQ